MKKVHAKGHFNANKTKDSGIFSKSFLSTEQSDDVIFITKS